MTSRPDRRDPLTAVADSFHHQGDACQALGSPLWGEVCHRLADDIVEGGPTADLIGGHVELRFGLALPLRLVGAVHRLALSGQAPDLAAHLPSCRPDQTDRPDRHDSALPDVNAVWAEVTTLLSSRGDDLRAALDEQVQTNEVGRSSGLILGLAAIARATDLPITLLEIGCSAGLNLRLDRFGYSSRWGDWGDPSSPVQLRDRWLDDPDIAPGLHLDVRRRAGVDPFPIDPTRPESVLRLASFVWPDQTERRRLLLDAVALARQIDADVSAAPTVDWLSRQLADSADDGTMRVVMHSIMWQYVPKDERPRIDEALANASARGPVARLRFEPDLANRSQVRVDIVMWNDGRFTETHVADSCYHGSWVRPIAGAAEQLRG